jgi:uncharacterized SAM-binding protein YcdF (DUF218 family)
MLGERPEDEDEEDIVDDTAANSLVLHARIQTAVGIFLSKYDAPRGDVLVLSGGRVYTSDSTVRAEESLPNEAAVMLSFALDAGVPRDAIELLDAPINTIEVAISAKQLLTKWGVERLGIVTSDFHSARAQTIFTALMPAWPLTYQPCGCPGLHVEHVDRLAERERKLMAVMRDDLESYLQYLASGGQWPMPA